MVCKIVLLSGLGWFQVQGSTTAAARAVVLELMKQAQEFGSVLVARRFIDLFAELHQLTACIVANLSLAFHP